MKPAETSRMLGSSPRRAFAWTSGSRRSSRAFYDLIERYNDDLDSSRLKALRGHRRQALRGLRALASTHRHPSPLVDIGTVRAFPASRLKS
jgi:hypothetical protein